MNYLAHLNRKDPLYSYLRYDILPQVGVHGTPDFRVIPQLPASSIFGQDLIVDVTWQYDFLLLPNFSSGVLSNPLTLSARTVMKYE